MKKCCFIIPYFGKLPKSFAVFLKSCSYNTEFNWLVFTDDHCSFDYPDNFIVKYTTLKEISELAEKKFGFHVTLDQSYKLCDIKPAYGFLFEEYLQGYQFWGHCDIDTIMGNLSKFLTDELLNQYDKLFCMGHMILYRNTFENNRIFMSLYNGRLLYKDVFTTPSICWFDEEWNGHNNINQIFLSKGKKVLQEDWSANFNVYVQKFERDIFCVDEKTKTIQHVCEKKHGALYIWDNGNACRYFIEKDHLEREDFLYMHFQWRKMSFKKEILIADRFKIVPNAYLRLDKLPTTIQEFKRIKKWKLCFYKVDLYYQMHILRRIKKLINALISLNRDKR